MKLIAGFNPAWQQVYRFDNLTTDAVNRASFFAECASGKGINALRGLEYLHDQADIIQCLAGEKGRRIADILKQDRVTSFHAIDETSETRTCTTVINGSEATELIGPTTPFSADFEQKMLSIISQLPNYQSIAIVGTLPAGISTEVYRQLINSQPEARIILDAFKDISALLSEKIFLLKINREELFSLTDEKDFKLALNKILATGIKNILVTNGAKPATLASQHEIAEIAIPTITDPINPIGAGDSATAYLLHKIETIQNFRDLKELAEEAMKFASESCKNILPGFCQTK